MKYLKDEESKKRLRSELIFAPIIIFLPNFVALLFIYNWFNRGFITGDPSYLGEMIVGLIILFSNLIFSIPFIRFEIPFVKSLLNMIVD